MTKLILITISLILVSCGPPKFVDPEFEPYVDSFKQNAKIYNVPVIFNLNIRFGDFSKQDYDVVGYCDWKNDIYIKRSTWEYYGWATREELIYHELGHCVLNKWHVNTFSIMRPYLLSEQYYFDNRTMLIKEFFTGVRE